jgi:hypothetical protein
LTDYQKVEFTLNPIIEIEDTKKPITLKKGDIVVFSAKAKPGRPQRGLFN